MSPTHEANPKTFNFRHLHPQILLGTASDRYAAWIGQICSKDHYEGLITKRSRIIAGKTLIEEVLPVDSVKEFFEHFPVLKIISLFLLLDRRRTPVKSSLSICCLGITGLSGAGSIPYITCPAFWRPFFISTGNLKFDDRVCYSNTRKCLHGTPACFHNLRRIRL